jgi:hypothetical protein
MNSLLELTHLKGENTVYKDFISAIVYIQAMENSIFSVNSDSRTKFQVNAHKIFIQN